MQYVECVKELFVVVQLIVYVVQCDDFFFEVQGVQLILDCFLVFLNFVEISGWDVKDQYVVLVYQCGGVIFQIVQCYQFGVDDIVDFFCGYFGVVGIGVVKQIYIYCVNILIFVVNGGQCIRKVFF